MMLYPTLDCTVLLSQATLSSTAQQASSRGAVLLFRQLILSAANIRAATNGRAAAITSGQHGAI